MVDFTRLDEHLKASARDHGNDFAYSYLDKRVTYSELYSRVLKISGYLYEAGYRKGDGIALILPNSDAFLEMYHGALAIGMFVVPLNPLYTPNELLYMLKDSGVKVIVAPVQMAPIAPMVMQALPGVSLIVAGDSYESIVAPLITFDTVVAHQPIQKLDEKLMIDDLAVVLYTSGTTGKPKGAMLTHQNLSSNAMMAGIHLRFSGDDRIVTVLPMFHVFSLTVCVNAGIFSAAELIILPRFSPKEVIKVIEETKATIFAGVPTMYNFIMQAAGDTHVDFHSLRYCISGGAAMPVAILNAFEKRFDVIVLEGYGLSEASPVTAFAPVDGRPRKVGSIGVSLPMVEQRVVDEQDQEVPVGEVGELVVRGPNVMKGYLGRPEDTQKALRDGWLHTGDMAKMDEDQYFYIVDRKKDMILVGGFNVYPREVEEVLFTCDGVLEAAVVGVPNSDYGEEVVACIVRKNESITAEYIERYCESHLAKYKLPTRILFMDDLPKNMTGKVVRRELREQLQDKAINNM
ncbi:MAG: long-chain fatty acid--CoA ligase [Acidibacillus sp.]|uniref:Long-chain-fatty-acid--CoA ligase n=1 Tax=Sulfoacidibacillus ferrooxidans TaxID=2005001 RepID=A0A9X1V8J1_9BACL|nr:Long-chain-fatty-acid--CoA ligase [Sulfoacidibacillus ferrooxidans]MCY0893790.1 long-chain fatty acid--CoA ligase [Acidibacillus sp.]